MLNVLFAAHIIVAVLLIGLVLVQRSEGGLGALGGGGGDALMSGSSAGDVLSRTTRTLFILFVVLSLLLARMVSGAGMASSVVEKVQMPVTPAPVELPASTPVTAPETPAAAPAQEAPATPQAPAHP